MWNDSPGRVDVLVLITAPLLQAGVCATLREAGRFNVIAGGPDDVSCALTPLDRRRRGHVDLM